MVPRQNIVTPERIKIEAEIHLAAEKGVFPERKPKLVSPAIKPRSSLPSFFKDAGQPSVTPAEYGFQEGNIDGVVNYSNIPATLETGLEISLLLGKILAIFHSEPLKGGMRLGDERRKA
jgi:hypothetical protein